MDARNIDPKMVYLVSGKTLRALLRRPDYKGVVGQIRVSEDGSIGLDNIRKFFGVENGAIAAWMMPGLPIAVEEA